MLAFICLQLVTFTMISSVLIKIPGKENVFQFWKKLEDDFRVKNIPARTFRSSQENVRTATDFSGIFPGRWASHTV